VLNFSLAGPSEQDDRSGREITDSGMNDVPENFSPTPCIIHPYSAFLSNFSFAGPLEQDDTSGCQDTDSGMNELMGCS
jgi:hypothetical protein